MPAEFMLIGSVGTNCHESYKRLSFIVIILQSLIAYIDVLVYSNDK